MSPNGTPQGMEYLRYERTEAISVGNLSRPRGEGDPEDGPENIALVVVRGKTVMVRPDYAEEFERRYKPQLKRGGGLKRIKHEGKDEQDEDHDPQAAPSAPARGAAASRTSGRSMASQPSEVTNPIGSSEGSGS